MKSWLQRLIFKRGGSQKNAHDCRDRLSKVIGPKQHMPTLDGLQRLIDACRDLDDGDPCSPAIYVLIEEEMSARRAATGTEFGPSNPRVSGLVVKRSGLPDWWQEGGNLLLVGADIGANISTQQDSLLATPTGCVAIIGTGATAGTWTLSGAGALFVVGDGAGLLAGITDVRERSTVLIGERANAMSSSAVTAMNGGIIAVGADALWAGGVIIITDDFHAIRDKFSNKRVNVFGGRIIVDNHVWLALNVTLHGDCHVGRDSVVGIGAMVKNTALPANCVAAGRPAEVVREDVVWSIDDLP